MADIWIRQQESFMCSYTTVQHVVSSMTIRKKSITETANHITSASQINILPDFPAHCIIIENRFSCHLHMATREYIGTIMYKYKFQTNDLYRKKCTCTLSTQQ